MPLAGLSLATKQVLWEARIGYMYRVLFLNSDSGHSITGCDIENDLNEK